MIYNQFSNSFSSNFASNPLLQRTPTSFTQTFNPFGGTQTRMGYGMQGLGPTTAAAAQKQEFGRLSSLQGLQQGAFNLSEQMRQSEESKQMEAARRRIFEESSPTYQANRQRAERSEFGFTQQYIDPFYLERARREKEMEDVAMQRARGEASMYGGGLFSSWATPSFPSSMR
jgi:hypothetical protein